MWSWTPANEPTFAVWDGIKQTEHKQGVVVIIGALKGAVHHVQERPTRERGQPEVSPQKACSHHLVCDRQRVYAPASFCMYTSGSSGLLLVGDVLFSQFWCSALLHHHHLNFWAHKHRLCTLNDIPHKLMLLIISHKFSIGHRIQTTSWLLKSHLFVFYVTTTNFWVFLIL